MVRLELDRISRAVATIDPAFLKAVDLCHDLQSLHGHEEQSDA